MKFDYIIDVPPHIQERLWSCGAAALTSFLHFHNFNVSESYLRQHLGFDEKFGTSIFDIGNLLLNKFNVCLNIEKFSLQDIKISIKNGFPILLPIQAYAGFPIDELEKNYEFNKRIDEYEKEYPVPSFKCDYKLENSYGHFAVAIGYNDEYLCFVDPSIKFLGILSYNDFLDRWHYEDSYGTYHNLGLTIFNSEVEYKLPLTNKEKKVVFIE